MNLLRTATLSVRDPEASAQRYVRWMDYTVVERGRVDAGLAQSWGAPAVAGRAFSVCRPASGGPVFVRFVQGEPPPDDLPLRTYGWAAIELCVPIEQKHAIATAGHGSDVFLEFDRYPAAATPHDRRPAELPPGVALATLEHPDLDGLDPPWFTSPAPRHGAIYEGRRVGAAAGPDGTLTELMEVEGPDCDDDAIG